MKPQASHTRATTTIRTKPKQAKKVPVKGHV